MKPRHLIAFAILIPWAGARAEAAEEKVPWTVTADVQMVSVSREQGLALLPQLRDARTIDAAFERLQKIIEAEPAALLAWPHLHTRGGEESWARNIEENRCPDPNDPVGKIDVHHLGPEFQATPIVQTGGTNIQLEITARFVRLRGIQRYPAGQSPIGFKHVLEQPEFSISSVQTTLSIANGGRLLLGSFFVPAPKPHVELFMLHATAVRADFPKPKTPAP